jgi:hypothetical protein
MSWLDEAIPMLRILINDLSAEPEYSDSRLTQLLISSARLVKMELDFDNDYTISVATLSITPDPLAQGEEEFINFAVLYAACVADAGQFRAKALLEGIRVSCGPASISVGGHLKGFQTLLEVGPCKTYEELKMQYMFGDRAPAKGIFGPFVNNKFDPRSLGWTGADHRHRC